MTLLDFFYIVSIFCRLYQKMVKLLPFIKSKVQSKASFFFIEKKRWILINHKLCITFRMKECVCSCVPHSFSGFKMLFDWNAVHIPVELRPLWIGIVQCSDCRSIHDDAQALFSHQLRPQTIRTHHQWHGHRVFSQTECRPVHRARDMDHRRSRRNPTNAMREQNGDEFHVFLGISNCFAHLPLVWPCRDTVSRACEWLLVRLLTREPGLRWMRRRLHWWNLRRSLDRLQCIDCQCDVYAVSVPCLCALETQNELMLHRYDVLAVTDTEQRLLCKPNMHIKKREREKKHTHNKSVTWIWARNLARKRNDSIIKHNGIHMCGCTNAEI